MNDFITNPSVIGFFIEQATLSSIASRGLEISEQISRRMETVMFSGRFPLFSNRTEGDPVLYCPLDFNFRAIDGIIVRFAGRKCFMFPIQITVAKRHSNSEEGFFSEWETWTKDLNGLEIEPVFVWITKKDSEVDTVDAKYLSTRSGDKLIHPSYCRQKVPLERVNLKIWERYQRALGKLQEHIKGLLENDSETENVGGKKVEEKKGEEARSGGPSATAGPSVQESGGKGRERREDYMMKKVSELKELLKNRSKP